MKWIYLILIFPCFHTQLFAQSTAMSNATVTIVTPVSISKNIDMSFGNISLQRGTGGTVTLAPTSKRTGTSGIAFPASAGNVTAASFTITGLGSYTYDITLPTSVTVTRSGGVATMTASSFSSNPSTTGSLSSGTQEIAIGASLSIGANQPAGTYTSTSFNVTVNYN